MRPILLLVDFGPNRIHLVLQHFDAFARSGVFSRDHWVCLPGLHRSIKPELVIQRVLRLDGFGVLNRDPVQPRPVGLFWFPRHENGPGFPKVRLAPLASGSLPVARSPLAALTERWRTVRNNDVAQNLRPRFDVPRRSTVRSGQGIYGHDRDGTRHF